MIKLLFFFVTCYVVIKGEDFFKFDYCTLNCPKEEHSSCHCKRKKDHEEITYDLYGFRKMVVEVHNRYRNDLALGNEKYYKEGAQDMMSMSYDLELEHCARCFAVSNWVGGHDHCRATKDKIWFGQNLSGRSVPPFKKDSKGNFINEKFRATDEYLMVKWWNEIKDIKDFGIVKKFYHPEILIGHWTQWVWATNTGVGCVRIFSPNLKVNAYKYAIICHYQSKLKSVGIHGSGNIINWPIFTPGKACSKCPDGTSCDESDYKGLCGKVQPVPSSNVTEIPLEGSGGNKGSKGNKGNGSPFIIISVSVIMSHTLLQ